MRRFFSRRTAIALELALGLIVFASIVSGCFQAVGAVDVTPGEGTPTLGFTPSPQPTAFVVQPTQTGLFPPTVIATATSPVAVAQDVTATPDNGGQVFNDPQVTQTLVQMTLNAQATQILMTVTRQAELDSTLVATQLGTGLPPGVAPATTPAPGRPLPAVTGTPEGTPGAPGSGAAGPITGDCIYTVVEGDRLFRIAGRFGLTTAEVARANGIVNPDLISVGQRLTIPDCNTPKTPTPAQAAADTGATAAPSAAGGSGQTYVVQDGDTLYGIATKFGVKVMALAQANNITNINLIYIGQTLVIP